MKKRKLLIVDGQGGGIGKQLVEAVLSAGLDVEIIAVGTNAAATSAMIKAGAPQAATGENAAAVCARNADWIVGPVGIAIADSLLGEITPRVALAIGQSPARKLLLPVNHCDNIIVGVEDLSIRRLVAEAVRLLREDLAEE